MNNPVFIICVCNGPYGNAVSCSVDLHVGVMESSLRYWDAGCSPLQSVISFGGPARSGQRRGSGFGQWRTRCSGGSCRGLQYWYLIPWSGMLGDNYFHKNYAGVQGNVTYDGVRQYRDRFRFRYKFQLVDRLWLIAHLVTFLCSTLKYNTNTSYQQPATQQSQYL